MIVDNLSTLIKIVFVDKYDFRYEKYLLAVYFNY